MQKICFHNHGSAGVQVASSLSIGNWLHKVTC